MDGRKIFEYVYNREKYDKTFKNSIRTEYKKNARKSNFLMRSIVGLLSVFVKPKPDSVKYFFLGNKYSEIITGLPKSETCVIGGPKSLLFCIKHQIKFIPCMRMWNVLLLGIVNNLDYSKVKLDKLIGNLSFKIDKFKSFKSVLVVDNDSLPMQRSVITAARQANIEEVVCIQHGIFQSKSPRDILDGWFSDRFFVINDIQKQLLIEKGMDEKKIEVMGFHKSPYKPKRPLSKNNERKVCFLGQPWLKYDGQKGQRYLEIVALVSRVVNEMGYMTYYKPHPWEGTLSFLNNKMNRIYRGILDEAIEKFDVFISITSTALYEAAASGRIAIQVYDEIFESDDMGIYSNISSVHVSSENFVNDIMDLITKEYEYHFDIHQPAVKRFLDRLVRGNVYKFF